MGVCTFGRFRRTTKVIALVGSVLGAVGLVTACGSGHGPPTINYVVDADISTYNANTVTGNAAGVLMATTRVLPGFSLLGASGQVTPDRDVGTVTRSPGRRQTLSYQFAPRAQFSDSMPLDCDDLVLAWAAMSGKFPGFTPATTAGYRDIESVECAPGDRSATVRFAAGRDYQDWRSLFGAGTLLPAHVVARAAGIADVVAPIRAMNRPVIERMAAAWNTGFDLEVGEIDDAQFPASGPYRISRRTPEHSVELVANDAWWGERPAVARIVVWGRGADTKSVSSGTTVVDTAAGLQPADADGARPPGQALAVEGVVLSGTGVFADVRTRRAFAACVPRNRLARELGQGAQMWNMRTMAPGDVLAGSINTEFGRGYLRTDPDRTRSLLAEVAASDGRPPTRTVRIGYAAPSPRWSRMVAAINDSCQPAGISVTDASQSTTGAGDLGRAVDALLVANGSAFAAAGAADPIRDAYQLRGGDPLNRAGLSSAQANAAIDALAVASGESDRLGLVRTIEAAAWELLPSIPLFAAPRVQRWDDRVGNVVAGLSRNGTGWNMDRWTLT